MNLDITIATGFPHIDCDWPNTRPIPGRLLADVGADRVLGIASGNAPDFFHLSDTPAGRKPLAAMP